MNPGNDCRTVKISLVSEYMQSIVNWCTYIRHPVYIYTLSPFFKFNAEIDVALLVASYNTATVTNDNTLPRLLRSSLALVQILMYDFLTVK